MATLTWPDKDPNEVLDYAIDWTARLDGDTIAASTWIVPIGITRDSDSFSASATTIWLSGGDTGVTAGHVLTNRITTAAGRIMDQSVTIRVVEK